MKNQRKLVLSLLILVALVVSGFTFAYWAGGITVTNPSNSINSIAIGEGKTISTTVNVTASTLNTRPLVPTNRQETGVSVNTVTYSFEIDWAGSTDSSTTGATAPLTVTPTLSLTGLNSERVNHLFTATTSHTAATPITFGKTTVTVTVTFANEPADAAEYALVANKSLTLTVVFALGTVTPA